MAEQFNGKIYITTNMIDGNQYVGQTISEKSTYFGSGIILKRNINKIGKENFKREIIKNNIKCQTALDLYEIIYIKKFKTLIPNGYNISEGGSGGGGKSNKGIKRSKEFCDNVSKFHKGKPGIKKTDEMKKNHSLKMTGLKHTQESKDNMSKSHKGKIGNLSNVQMLYKYDEYIQLRIEGLNYKQAAEMLNINVRTSRNYWTNYKKRLNK